MYNVKRHISWKRHINKGKAIGSTLKISHFVSCETPSSQCLDVIRAEMLFTCFCVMHTTLCAADILDSCSGTSFREIKLQRRTICATLKIKLLRLKSDFATLKSSEGLAALVCVCASVCVAYNHSFLNNGV